jgi:hypothetical protein
VSLLKAPWFAGTLLKAHKREYLIAIGLVYPSASR